MANTTQFGPDLSGVTGTCSLFGIRKDLTNGTASPEVIFNAANVVVRAFTVFDFMGWNNTGGAQAGATFTLQSNLNGAGAVAVSDALAVALNDSRADATTIDPAQAGLSVGAATEDVLQVAKNANTDAGVTWTLAYIT